MFAVSEKFHQPVNVLYVTGAGQQLQLFFASALAELEGAKFVAGFFRKCLDKLCWNTPKVKHEPHDLEFELLFDFLWEVFFRKYRLQ